MPHTVEQRSAHALCGARRKNGSTCRLFAGHGTSHKGFGQCRLHGGATPNGEKYALALEARHSMIARSVPVEDAEPHLVLLQELGYSAGHVNFLREEISSLDPAEIGGERSKVLLHRYDSERDRLTRIAKTCSEAGVDEARIRIADAHAVLLTQAISTAAQEAGLSRDQVRALGPALRKQLALQAGDTQAAEAADARVTELRERLRQQDEQRIERAGQRYAGLVPASELGIRDDETSAL